MADVRVRIAPSPTGPLHIGTARTALYNYLHARHVGGTFILRLEDTDQARSSIAYEKDILDGLHWLGLTWDEGPEVAGEAARAPRAVPPDGAPAALRRRGPAAARRGQGLPLLLHARGAGRRAGRARRRPRRRRATRDGAPSSQRRSAPPSRPRAAARPFASAWAEGTVAFDDVIRGHVEFDVANLGGDFVIVRADGSPLYHFTVVVDDAAMGITDVIRGEDHLSNTPKHILLFRALGPRAAALRPPAADPQPGSLEDEQAQEPDRAERLHRPGLHPRGARQLPRAPRLGDGHRGGDPRRSTRSSSGSTSPRSTRAAPCSTASGWSGSTASGSGA